MKLNIKKTVVAGMVTLSLLSVAATSAFAAPTYNYKNYIGSGQTFATWSMKKDNNGNTYYGQWRLRVNGSYANGKYVTLKGELREGSRKHGYQLAKELQGSVWANNTAKAGANVHLVGKRHDMQKECTVWGTWSSDRT